MNLCLICLRSDRMLKLVSNVLEEFHDELCGFSVVNLTSYFCLECGYLLTKFYKFKQKCVNAQTVYHKWMSQASKTLPLNLLHTLLPPSPLGMWTSNPEKMGNFAVQEVDSTVDLCSDDEFAENKYTNEVKIEYEQSFSDCTVLKNENNTENTTDTGQIKIIKIECETEDVSNNHKTLDPPVSDPNIKHESQKSIEKISPDTKIKFTVKKEKKVAGNKSIKKPSEKMIANRKAYFDQLKEDCKLYESVFDIEYLTTNEMKVEEFQRRKTYPCYVNAEHKCEICYQAFKSLKLLEYHTTNWHKESAGSVLCSICNTWSPKRNNHKTTHNAVFKCKLCLLVTYHKKTVKYHFEQHTGKQYHCEQCNVTYKSNSVYVTHMGKVHRRGRHVCARCGRGFRSPRGLLLHANKSSRCTAGGAAPPAGSQPAGGVRCDECDITLPSQEVYEAHIFDVHEPRRQAVGSGPRTGCIPSLPQNTTSQGRPQTIRRKLLKVICQVCKKAGGNFAWLQLHCKREHPEADVELWYADKRKHLCDVCGAGFISVYLLRDHMHKHTGARPHACDLCPKRFRTSILLRQHRVIHFPSTLPCSYCGKQFKTTSNLYAHIKGHIGEKNYKCDICGKAFLHSAAVKEHVRGVHHNIRRAKRGATRVGVGNQAKRGKKTVEADSEGGDSSG